MRFVRCLMMFVVLLGLVACNNDTTPTNVPTPSEATPDAGAMELVPIPIDSVVVQVRESMPPQIAVQVQGSLPDGCTEFDSITQNRQGNVVEVSIMGTRPKAAVACTMMLELYSETILLEGDFPTGSYTVRVNGVEAQFDI